MKRQTLILVVIGLVLFVAGGAIAFATVIGGTKHSPTSSTVAPVNTPVVVAVKDIPAGSTGQLLVSQGLVSIQLIPQKKVRSDDLTSLLGLSDEVLTSSVTKGNAIQTTQLTPSTSTISLPKGLDGITITTTGVSGLAGYLQPGSNVDVYANVTKLSSGSTASSTSNTPIPCTELVMSDIQVLDVSSVAPALGSHPSSTGRAVPTSLTLLLAVSPAQARVLTFMAQNETLSVAQTQKGASAVTVGECIGTGQTTVAP
jgi:Flp pilus assembly protein CpaB